MKAPTLFGQLQLCDLFVAQVGFILDIRSYTGEEIYLLTVDHKTWASPAQNFNTVPSTNSSSNSLSTGTMLPG